MMADYSPFGERIVIMKEHTDRDGTLHLAGEMARVYRLPKDVNEWTADLAHRPDETLVVFGGKLPPIAVKNANFKRVGEPAKRGVVS